MSARIMSWMRIALALLVIASIPGAFWLGWRFHVAGSDRAAAPVSANSTTSPSNEASTHSGLTATNIYAHNLMLRKGPDFRVYVRWLRGRLTPANKNETPSFDDPESFFLEIHDGVLRANIGDIAHYLNAGGLGNSPLKNVTIWGDGAQINLKGTLHKIVSLPVQISGELAVLSENKVRVHVNKISVLKVPFKALLGILHVTVADLAGSSNVPGVQISGNDILFDTQKLLPPPHIRGQLKLVHIVNPDLEEVFGSTQEDLARVAQWRNFLSLKGGSIEFGKLTMHDVDLIMIDISNDAWFDLDLAHYQKQLVNGYTRMTPQAALQIFMPDLSNIPENSATKSISLEWLKNRNAPVPNSVTQR